MKIFIALILLSIFFFLAGIHFYWGVGGKWGFGSAIPTDEKGKAMISPKALDCFIVAIGLLFMGVVILIRSGLIINFLPSWISNYGLWFVALIFLMRAIGEFKYLGLFKKIKNTDFGIRDTRYYTPLCIVVSLLIIVLQIL